MTEAMVGVDPRLPRWADDFIFGEVWADDVLSEDERMMVAITALAAMGHHTQLRNYLHGALEAGIPAPKIHESLTMLVVYAGFPTAIGSLVVWREVAASAARRGIDLQGFEA